MFGEGIVMEAGESESKGEGHVTGPSRKGAGEIRTLTSLSSHLPLTETIWNLDTKEALLMSFTEFHLSGYRTERGRGRFLRGKWREASILC